ncbi:MAG: AMP-binding protein, partial [Myxococcales bacterium]|nr:AMP-binding protein [Myxococcales bacterium]
MFADSSASPPSAQALGETLAPEPIVHALRRMGSSHPTMAATHVPARAWPFSEPHYRTATFAELDRRSEAIAAGFTELGVGPGVKVAMLVPPTEDFFALAFGLLKAGAVPVLVDPGIGLAHLKACLGEAEPEAFVGVPKAHLARQLFGWCPSARVQVSVGGGLLGRFLAGGPSLAHVEQRGDLAVKRGAWRAPNIGGDTLAVVVFTSGSIGVPKGVEYRHAELAAQARMLRTLYGIEPGLTNVATFPPFALFGPSLGMTTVIPKMDPTRTTKVK